MRRPPFTLPVADLFSSCSQWLAPAVIGLATLRNLAINTLRDAGHSNNAAGLRHTSYEPFTGPLALLGIA
jgi:hypothetical protein